MELGIQDSIYASIHNKLVSPWAMLEVIRHIGESRLHTVTALTDQWNVRFFDDPQVLYK